VTPSSIFKASKVVPFLFCPLLPSLHLLFLTLFLLSPFYKDPYDYIGTTQVIQDDLPILRSLTLLYLQNLFYFVRFQGSGHEHLWRSPSSLPGFPDNTGGKEPVRQCRRYKRQGFNPWGWEDPLEEGMATHSNYSFLEYPMNREARQATVHRIAKGRTWPKRLSTHTLIQPTTQVNDEVKNIFEIYWWSVSVPVSPWPCPYFFQNFTLSTIFLRNALSMTEDTNWSLFLCPGLSKCIKINNTLLAIYKQEKTKSHDVKWSFWCHSLSKCNTLWYWPAWTEQQQIGTRAGPRKAFCVFQEQASDCVGLQTTWMEILHY